MEKCSLQADKYIKSLIYKNKVTIFSKEDCEFSQLAFQHIKENYKHESKFIPIDKLNLNELKFNKNSLIECLKKRAKTNIVPMIFIYGMPIGNYRKLEEKTFLKELEIFF